MESARVLFPAAFVALAVKLNVPAAVGVPDIVPLPARARPPGNEPPARSQVIGADPVAARVWLYAVPVAPPGREAVVMLGAIAVAVISMESARVTFPEAFVALTVKLNVPVAVGVPDIVPFAARDKPPGNVPLAISQAIGVVPVAASVWLYAVPSTPPGK